MYGYKEFMELKRELKTDIGISIVTNDSEVIGYTSSGKPINIKRATMSYENFTAEDHYEAAIAYAFRLQIYSFQQKAKTKLGICYSRMSGHKRIAEKMMEYTEYEACNNKAIYYSRVSKMNG